MKRILFTASLLMPGLAFAQSFNYDLEVQLTSVKKPVLVYVIQSYGWPGQKTLDSAFTSNGIARFRGTLEEPAKVHVLVDHNGQGSKWKLHADATDLYLEKGRIVLKGKDSATTAIVKSGAINQQFARYKDEVLVLFKEQAAAARHMPEQSKPPMAADSLLKMFQRLAAQTDTLKLQYIRKYPGSFISLVALKELAGKDINMPLIEPIFNSLSADVRKTRTGRDFAKKLEEERLFAAGATAPDFTQNDVNGKPVKLSDYRGQYVLVDFWASWCVPCRGENPNLVKAYHAFKNKNFTVLGVSLDSPGKKQDWLAAISKDSLTWTQVSDLKGWKNEAAQLYKIRSIPQNYLIDPAGKIVAKNLRGERLHAELRRILK